MDKEKKFCKTCGIYFSDIVNLGTVGCADCYYTFFEELSPLISKLHGRTTYLGKIPKSSAPRLNSISLLEQLKNELKEAIEMQNFERAAVLRDKIKELEAE